MRRLVLLSPARGYGAAELRDSGAQVRRQRLENLERFGIDGMASERTARLLGRNPSEEALAWVRWNMARLNPEGYRQAVELLCGDDLLGNGQPAAPCEVHCGEDDGITTPGVAAPSPASSARRSRRFPGPATPARSNNPKWSQDASATRNASLLKEPPMDKSDDSQDKYIVPGLERGLLLLCEFSRKDCTLTAPELARRLKLPRSTIFRLLTTLEAMGFVTRNGNEYRLGMAVLRLGFEYLASLELTELGQPLLNRLCDEIRYPCNLVVRDGRSIVYVAKVSPSTPLSSSVNVGTRLPAHATVLGRILLQDLSLGELRELYPEEQLEQFSPNTRAACWNSSTWSRATASVASSRARGSSRRASPPSRRRYVITAVASSRRWGDHRRRAYRPGTHRGTGQPGAQQRRRAVVPARLPRRRPGQRHP